MVTIQRKIIRYNFSSGNQIKYIVVHDTGNRGRGANALAHYSYFNGGNRQSSAHYFVDDHSIVQLVDDRNASWHCGDGHGRYGITNHNSIGIETCINNDGNYAKAINNTIDLVKYLMKKYNININHVVRHYDASRKNCPQMMNQDGKWSGWINFKRKLVQPVSVPSQKAQSKYDKVLVYNNNVDKATALYYLYPILKIPTIHYAQIKKYPAKTYIALGAVIHQFEKDGIKNVQPMVGRTRWDTMILALKFIHKL